jgi:hypothetical protein
MSKRLRRKKHKKSNYLAVGDTIYKGIYPRKILSIYYDNNLKMMLLNVDLGNETIVNSCGISQYSRTPGEPPLTIKDFHVSICNTI